MSGFNYTTPDEVGALLNKWEDDHPLGTTIGGADDIWRDLIRDIPGYDPMSTEALDPMYYGTLVVVEFRKPHRPTAIPGPSTVEIFKYDPEARAWRW